MGFFAEFKTFIMRGNVVDLAVGVVIGAAFGKIVSSFVSDVLMPPLGLLTGGIDFSNLQWVLKSHTDDKGALIVDAALKYGLFINNIINFVIQAAAIFILIKLINMLYKKQAAAPAPPTKQEELLTEIRDILAAKKA